MYISEYCEVDYEEKYNVVLVKWKKFCCNQDYRKPLEYALDIIREHENCDYVADTRSGFENNSLKEELEGQANDSSDKIEFRYIYSLEEIEK